MTTKYFKKDPRLGYLEWPAYLIDLYRVFPRVLFLGATWMVWQITWWYMFGLQKDERSTEVSVVVGVIFAAWTKALDYYMQRGVDWSKRMQINGGEYSNTTTTTIQSGGS